jgi:hypothetical protein
MFQDAEPPRAANRRGDAPVSKYPTHPARPKRDSKRCEKGADATDISPASPGTYRFVRRPGQSALRRTPPETPARGGRWGGDRGVREGCRRHVAPKASRILPLAACDRQTRRLNAARGGTSGGPGHGGRGVPRPTSARLGTIAAPRRRPKRPLRLDTLVSPARDSAPVCSVLLASCAGVRGTL